MGNKKAMLIILTLLVFIVLAIGSITAVMVLQSNKDTDADTEESRDDTATDTTNSITDEDSNEDETSDEDSNDDDEDTVRGDKAIYYGDGYSFEYTATWNIDDTFSYLVYV